MTHAEWERQREELRDRVLPMIDGASAGQESTASSRLSVLGKAHELVANSMWAGTIGAELGGRHGMLIDLIEQEMVFELECLSIATDPEAVSASSSEPVSIAVSVESACRQRVGRVPVVIRFEDVGRPSVSRFNSDDDGRHLWLVDVRQLSRGKNLLVAYLNVPRLGIEEDRLLVRLPAVEKAFIVENMPRSVAVAVRAPEGVDGSIVETVIKSILSRSGEVVVSLDSAQSAYVLVVEIDKRHGAKNDYGILMEYASARFDLQTEGRTVFSHRTDEYKEGGSSQEQADERVMQKLLEAIEEDASLADRIVRAVKAE